MYLKRKGKWIVWRWNKKKILIYLFFFFRIYFRNRRLRIESSIIEVFDAWNRIKKCEYILSREFSFVSDNVTIPPKLSGESQRNGVDETDAIKNAINTAISPPINRYDIFFWNISNFFFYCACDMLNRCREFLARDQIVNELSLIFL